MEAKELNGKIVDGKELDRRDEINMGLGFIKGVLAMTQDAINSDNEDPKYALQVLYEAEQRVDKIKALLD